MAGRLSQDLKERIVRSVMDEGYRQAETARRLMLTEATVSRTMRVLRERGTIAPVSRSVRPLARRRSLRGAVGSPPRDAGLGTPKIV